MAEASLKLGGSWATKEGSLLGFNDENGNYKPIPFDFTRATTATRVNRDGLIEEVQSGVPRIDFSGDGSLLLEPQRTNLITDSEDFTTGWNNLISGSGINPIVTSNQGTSPDGTLNADKVVFDLNGGTANSDYSLLNYNLSGFSNPHTLDTSIYLKSSDGNNYQVVIYNRGTGLEPITVTNQWQRFSVNGTRSNTSNNFRIGLFGDNSSNTASLYIWGAQAEEGSYPTSYIPTSGSAVTRVADSCSKTGASDYIGQTEGTLFWDFDAKNTGGYASGFFTTGVDDGSYNNAVGLVSNSPSDTELRGIYRVGGSTVFLGSSFNVTNQRNKIAIVWTASSIKMFKNGALETTLSKSAFTTTMSYFYFPTTARSAHYNANQILSFTTALSDTELAELTTL